MEEDWEDAVNEEEWAESDAVEEKKAIAGIIQDSRSWGRRARCKIEEFRANEIRHCTQSKQERGFMTTRQKTRHQKRQLTEQTAPDPGRNGTDKAAVFHKNRSTPHNEHRVPPSSQNSQFSRHQSTEPGGSQEFDAEMHAIAWLIPRQEFGRRPFDRQVLINTQFGRTIISEDMEYLLGTMEVVTAPGPVDLRDANGQEMSCTGIISFSMKFLMPNGTDFEDNSCQVTAWVSPMLPDNIIVGSMTLADLGYPGVEDIPAGVVFHIDPQPWDAQINDPSRPPGGRRGGNRG
jgi:hypothetical protein